MKVACKGHRHQEGTQKRKNRKQKMNKKSLQPMFPPKPFDYSGCLAAFRFFLNKQKTTTYYSFSVGYAKKAVIQAAEDNPHRKTRQGQRMRHTAKKIRGQ